MNKIDTRRKILFLQGPPSTFWRQLAEEFESAGFIVHRINLSMGDWAYWRKRGADNYRGRFANWAAFLKQYLNDKRITDILYYADRLPYHAVAREVAAALDIRTYAMEFGYLRPDWLTLERGGMGALSHFPNDPQAIRRIAQQVHITKAPQSQFSHRFAIEAANEVVYNLITALFPYPYPYYRADKYYHPVIDYLSWIPNKIYSAFTEPKRVDAINKLWASKQRYWMLALQLQADYQIRCNSPYRKQIDMIREVIDSFARNASTEEMLVAKLHPLDNGLERWEAKIRALAKEYGVQNRVLTVSRCNLKRLIRRSRGVITINSTVGLHSLRAGTPVKTLGIAIYDIAGLTHQGALETFWVHPQPVDKKLTDDFVQAIANSIQIHGSFYHVKGRDTACREIVDRVKRNLVNEPEAFVNPPPRLQSALHRNIPVFQSLNGSNMTIEEVAV
ncbi:capsule biosynthesis protein [Bordetella sp. 15P40C-2]|uniref:capsule biosynthesis protein n=1 Tax=Bordetella sp. 15P40C-2 TaxID=2572246 RepID=UPI001322730C|nr:capsular biosynthesis protein [Bordetella sp. 15P40C-2]MVW73285.1 capsular biosynthesis protein [Bordetella sp. 15P40C-2]